MASNFTLVPYSGGPLLVIDDETWPLIGSCGRATLGTVNRSFRLMVRQHPNKAELYLVHGFTDDGRGHFDSQGEIVPELRVPEMLREVAKNMGLGEWMADACEKAFAGSKPARRESCDVLDDSLGFTQVPADRFLLT
jgi:hypothetical protein